MESKSEEKCHMCGNETDYCCQDCDQPVCEDCCVAMTLQNQIDYTLCMECNDSNEASEYLDRAKEWKREAEAEAKKEKREKARRAAYWKPENVDKRKVKKEALALARKQARDKMLEEAVSTVSQMFRGMF